ncbi:hypothetical protein EQ845_04900 [Pseudomonas putida]|uniref:gamma-mobile-trio protein GmtX n=1 Tax=Pseudomonas putida TaxID=303 RepID=UPI0011799BD9|nr:gamma-mobile-trio protein GmtX [Pseudomonas putida]TRO37830.1 hypothetical protein EQ845_04900 [Pseudomonas putida]
MTPEATLEHLKNEATPRTRRTLDAIYKVCVRQVERNTYDFAYSTISKLGLGTGVPKAQSIRNATGEPYRVLLQAFVNAAPKQQILKVSKGENAWIEDIEDLSHRYLARVLLSKLSDAQRTIREFVPPSMEITVDDRTSLSCEGSFVRFTKSESRALNFLLSDEFLDQWGFKRGDVGDVVDDNGKRVFKPGTIEALEKALRYL